MMYAVEKSLPGEKTCRNYGLAHYYNSGNSWTSCFSRKKKRETATIHCTINDMKIFIKLHDSKVNYDGTKRSSKTRYFGSVP